MLSWILPKNERWGNFMYWKMPQRSFFGRIQDAIICFRDLLTFSTCWNFHWLLFLITSSMAQWICLSTLRVSAFEPWWREALYFFCPSALIINNNNNNKLVSADLSLSFATERNFAFTCKCNYAVPCHKIRKS